MQAECAHYEDLITKTVSGEDPPLLSKAQLHWISDELWAAGQGKGVATNFLVFGLGERGRGAALQLSLCCVGQ